MSEDHLGALMVRLYIATISGPFLLVGADRLVCLGHHPWTLLIAAAVALVYVLVGWPTTGQLNHRR